jgi:hypothetical protein
MTNNLRARENREHIITTHTFVRRGINFPRVVEAPEARGDDPVVNQRVERGEEVK